MTFINLHKKHVFLGLIALCFLFSGCSYQEEQVAYNNAEKLETQPENLIQPLAVSEGCYQDQNDTSYRLGPEDNLNIIVYGEDSLSGEYTVSDTGNLDLPLIGNITVMGCNIDEAEAKIREKYAAGYLVNPSISTEIKSYKPFYITGEVQRPGHFDYVTDMTIIKAVALAGGFTYRADKKNVEVLKNHYSTGPIYKSSKVEDPVHPGDVIIIKERFF